MLPVFCPDIEFHFVSGSPASDGGRQIRKVGGRRTDRNKDRRRSRGERGEWETGVGEGKGGIGKGVRNMSRREEGKEDGILQAHGISDTMWQMYRPLAYRYC